MLKKLYLLPLCLIFFVPLIVCEKILILPDHLKNFWIAGVNFDYFSYYKSKVLLILVLFSLISLLYRLRKDEISIKSSKLYIPLFVYLFFIIMSTIFSKYKDISLWGFPDRYEGAMVLFSYIIIFFVFALVPKIKDTQIILNSFLISSFLIGVISMLQFFNLDFIKSYIVGKLHIFQLQYLGKVYIKFNPGPRYVYATLYNSNYVGSFMAISFIVTFILYVLNNEKKRIIYGILSVIMFFSLIACHSRAGILGVMVAVIFFAVYKYKEILKNFKFVAPILIIYLLVYVFINTLSSSYIGNKIESLFVDINKTITNSTNNNLRDVKIYNNAVCLNFDKATLNFVFDNEKIFATDENNKRVSFKFDSNKNEFLFENPTYSQLKYFINNYNNMPVLILNNGYDNLNLIKTKEGFKILSFSGKINNINPVDKIDVKGKEKLGSGRVYIWSRSIPLIKNTLFLGYGPDTYALYFPQYDYIGKFLFLGTPSILVDKPHNMYLQNAINIGVIGTLAFLIFILCYLIFSFKAINTLKDSSLSTISISIFFALIAYLVAGVFNDSVVYVAPLFWALGGLNFKILNN
ncbi:O-Antigen ligase [Caloramator proteoclasticus DSM 10124]|uniref:O-Antigen ligase n=1 Tax=Caloramator proteoclasticus DSM 10124 TaxID=1121262 RepID=A0A1M4ZLA2_9CLOT|nr:O-Antigen ligase [Caloramator proteoclasticus DSM 10124]